MKAMKKIISHILSAVMLIICVPSVLADSAGERYIDVELDSYESIVNGTATQSQLKLSAGGKAVYQMYIPFDAQGIEFYFSASDKSPNLDLFMNGEKYSTVLMATTEKNNVIKFPNSLLKGEYQMILCVDNPVDFIKIRVTKTPRFTETKSANYETVPNLSDYQKAIQTAVILSSKSPVFMVNGGRRYVNNDNPRQLAYVEGEEIYLPIHSFSRAFGYYYEQKENEWVLMKNNYTFHYKNGVLTKQDYASIPYAISNISKTVDGELYMPLKYFAELDAKVMKKKNDIYIIDYPSNVKEILEDKIFNELSQNYSVWNIEEKTGTTYYVSKTCNSCDDNDGSYEKPFKTIAKAAEVAKAGDTVIIRGGTYYEVLAPKNNGTVSNPITFKAAEGEEVILSSTAELGVPVGTQTNIYGQEMVVYNALTDLGYGKNQIFYKKQNLSAGRHPNDKTIEYNNPWPDGLSDLWPTQGNIQGDQTDFKTLSFSQTDLDQPAGTWNGATLISLQGLGWTVNMAKVASSEPEKLNITDVTRAWWFWPNHYEGNYAYLTNHINTVDKAGEWAYDDGKIYIIPPESETAATLKLEQKVRQICVDMTDSKYVRLEGINTYGGGMKLNNSEMCMLRDGEYKYISHYTYSLDQKMGYAEDADAFNQNGAPQRGEMGIYIGGRDNIVINNKMEYSAASAIYSVGLHEYFENNYMSECGYMGAYVCGLFVSTVAWEEADTPRGGNAVFGNTIRRGGRNCYSIATSQNWYDGSIPNVDDRHVAALLPDEVAYNDFYDGSITARDTGTWYQYGCVTGTERLWSRHHNNLIWNSWAAEGVMNAPIYYDGYTSMIENYDNVMFWTNDVEYQSNGIFIQWSAGAQSITKTWGNSDLGRIDGGKETLAKDDYPRGKKFRTGVDWLSNDKTPYLNSIDEKTSYITLENAEISSGASIKDGLFVANNNGDWICFKDVDFSTDNGNANKLSLYFTGNPYKTGDKITVIIGKSLTDYEIKESFAVTAKAPYDWAINELSIQFAPVISGKMNVYVIVDEHKSMKLSQIRMLRTNDSMANLKVGIYGDSGIVEGGNPRIDVIPDGEVHYAYGSLQGALFKFENIKVPEDCNELFTRFSTHPNQAGQLIKVRIGSAGGEVIGEYTVTGESWSVYPLRTVPLKKTLKAGTYDIYLECVAASGKTSNLLWFGFGYNEEYNTAQANG